MTSPLTLLAIALAAVLASAVFSRFAPLRSLFPAWRFFDRAVRSPRLFIRRGDAWSAFDDVLGPRPLGSALFAPQANLALAYQTAVDQLVSELGDLELGDASTDGIERDPRVLSLPSYQLVARIAAEHGGTQWKIIVPDEPGDYIVSEAA